jgi:pilus assembly protein CpaB
MKPQTLAMLMVAVGCGLAALFLSQRYLNRPTVEPDRETVWVAVKDIPSGVQITEAMIHEQPMLKEYVVKDAIRDKTLIVGKTARYHMSAQEIVREAKLGVGDGLASQIPPGMRAVTAKLKTESGVAGFINKDSRVDISVIVEQGMKRTVKTILQNVLVLAVNNKIERDRGSSDGQVVEMVTFLLTPIEAEQLGLAEAAGSLKLSLRSEADKSPFQSTGSDTEMLLGQNRNQNAARQQLEGQDPGKIILEDGKPKEQKGPSFLDNLGAALNKLADAKPAGKPEVKKDPEVVVASVPARKPAAPTPPKPPQKVLRYQFTDLAGNPLMEVLLPADSKYAESLKGQGELVDDLSDFPKKPAQLPKPEGDQPESEQDPLKAG